MKDFLHAHIFSSFPAWKAITYIKEVTPKILKFEVTIDEKEPRFLYLVSIISREEKLAWQSFQDVLDHTINLAQHSLRGFFGFDVISVDIQNELRNFDPKTFSQLIGNHAKSLGPGQKALIRYGQLFAFLHYRAPAEWGKVEVKTHVDFCNPESTSMEITETSVREVLMGTGKKHKKSSRDSWDLFLKRFLKESGGGAEAIYIVHDLSLHPLWDPANTVQQHKVRVWMGKEIHAQGGGCLPEIYYCRGRECLLVKE